MIRFSSFAERKKSRSRILLLHQIKSHFTYFVPVNKLHQLILHAAMCLCMAHISVADTETDIRISFWVQVRKLLQFMFSSRDKIVSALKPTVVLFVWFLFLCLTR